MTRRHPLEATMVQSLWWITWSLRQRVAHADSDPNRNTNGDAHSDCNHNAKSNAYTHFNCNADEYAYIDDDTHPDADFESIAREGVHPLRARAPRPPPRP
jgi:hypothetical protein